MPVAEAPSFRVAFVAFASGSLAFVATPALASEGGASFYLLGSGGPGAGELPPISGIFFDNTFYYYHGSAKAERQFLYMPLMHSERIADERLSLRLFAALGDASTLAFARSHARMIARFGRFPHRNAVLGRRSTAAERRAVEAGNAW